MTATDIAATLVLVAAPVPALRLPLDRRFRKLFGRTAFLVVVAVGAWWVGVAVLAAVARQGLVVVAVITGVSSLALWWRARPARGRWRGHPRGSLSLTRSLRGLAHRDDYQVQAERFGAIFRMMQPSGPVVCVVGLERGQRIIREHRDAIGPSPLPFTQQVLGGFLRYMDDDVHDVYGPLFRRAMSRAVTDAAAPVARAAMHSELQAIGSDAHDPSPCLQRIARATVLAALLGLRAGDTLLDEWVRHDAAAAWSPRLRQRNRRSLEGLASLREVVRRQGEALRTEPEPAVCALTELAALDPSMPDATCVDNLIFMVRIGSANVASLLRWVVQMLAAEPGWRDRLADQSATADPLTPDLHDAFVMEVLRLAQSEYVYRRVLSDVNFEGVVVPRGSLLRICVAESHRDASIFPAADVLTDRFHGHRPPQAEYSPFGFDRHACNSIGLSSMIARTVVEAIVSCPDLALQAAGGVARDLRHWSHWRPGPDLAWSRSGPSPR